MKNIYLIQTNNPSRLISSGKEFTLLKNLALDKRCKHIYITSDEEIEEGWKGWAYKEDVKGKIFKHFYTTNEWYKDAKKIILTTDTDLIKDNVQAIDDEFLEWFIRNTSCESIEVIIEYKDGYGNWYKYDKEFWDRQGNKPKFGTRYRIIIPKEEPKQELPQLGTKEFNDLASAYFGGKPKQETIKEAALREYPISNFENQSGNIEDLNENDRLRFIEGAKWQQKIFYNYLKIMIIRMNLYLNF